MHCTQRRQSQGCCATDFRLRPQLSNNNNDDDDLLCDVVVLILIDSQIILTQYTPLPTARFLLWHCHLRWSVCISEILNSIGMLAKLQFNEFINHHHQRCSVVFATHSALLLYYTLQGVGWISVALVGQSSSITLYTYKIQYH